MILNLNSLNISQKTAWAALAGELETLGFNLKVFSGSRRATVFNKETGDAVGEVTREMVEDEEMDYILYSRLQLERKTLA
jgi:hypothetical protein